MFDEAADFDRERESCDSGTETVRRPPSATEGEAGLAAAVRKSALIRHYDPGGKVFTVYPKTFFTARWIPLFIEPGARPPGPVQLGVSRLTQPPPTRRPGPWTRRLARVRQGGPPFRRSRLDAHRRIGELGVAARRRDVGWSE